MTTPDQPAAPVQQDDEDAVQPWYDLAWACGAQRHTSFAGDDLESLTFTPADFEQFCREMPTLTATDERINDLLLGPEGVKGARSLEAARDRVRRFLFWLNPSPHPAPGAGQQEEDGIPESVAVCYEVYQVVGSMLSDLGQFGTAHGDKVLDNLSEARLVHKDVLPWPSFERPHPVEAQQAASENAPLSDFQEGQWWIAELDAMVKDAGTQDQKRAVAVVHHLLRASSAAAAKPDAARASGEAPIDMVLHCPACGMQHIDRPDPPSQYAGMDGTSNEWTCPPHRSHLCRPEDGGCGHIWRPADVPTNGVAAVKTKGKADSPIATPAEPDAARVEADRRDAVSSALNNLIHAVNWRAAVISTSNDPEKIEFATSNMWEAVDAGKAALAAQQPSREERMVVLDRNAEGVPTIWCDPEIADIVAALNTHGLKTDASCSGHGHVAGLVSLADGREVLIAKDAAQRDLMMSVFPTDINGTPRQQPSQGAEPVAWLHVQGSHTEPSERPLLPDEVARGWTQVPLYAAPQPSRQAVDKSEVKRIATLMGWTPPGGRRALEPLTDDEIEDECNFFSDEVGDLTTSEWIPLGRALEKRLAAKNGLTVAPAAQGGGHG